MVCAAASASAATPSMTGKTVSAVLERSVGGKAMRAGTGATGSLLPFLPSLVASSSGAPRVGSGGAIFYDGFEGGMSNWSVWPTSGAPAWATTTYLAAAGSVSAYCAGSQIPAPGPYANNMNAQMIAGPFDLSTVTSATFQYKLHYNTEVDKDYVQAFVSIDNDMFYGPGYTGDSQGWTDKSIDLTNVYTLGNVCGKSRVWIAFFFVSNPTVTGEGAYVDEVSITAGGGGGGAAKLVLAADRTTVPYHGTVNLTGVLQDATSGSLLPNREVTWYAAQDIRITGSWYPLGTQSSTTGEYSQSFWIDKLTWFAFTFDGDGQYLEGVSNWVKVKAHAKVTPPAVPPRVPANVLITSWGTIKPPHTAAQNKVSHTKVYAQHLLGGKWGRAIAFFANSYRNVPAGGDPTETQYSLSLRWAPGKWRVWAVHQDAEHLKSTSTLGTFTAY